MDHNVLTQFSTLPKRNSHRMAQDVLTQFPPLKSSHRNPSPAHQRRKITKPQNQNHNYGGYKQMGGKNCTIVECNKYQSRQHHGRKRRTEEIKVVLLGKTYSGKTSMFHKYLTGSFRGEAKKYQATIGAAFGSKKLFIEDQPLGLALWDTGGSERFEAVSRLYYRSAEAAILCYDLTDRQSFERVKFWVKELQDNEPDCLIYVCGTKKDLLDEPFFLPRLFDRSEVMRFCADVLLSGSFETSSKTGAGIEEMFTMIAMDHLQLLKDERAHSNDSGCADSYISCDNVSLQSTISNAYHSCTGCS